VISFPFNSRPDRSGQKLNGEDGFPHSEICGSKVAHTSPQLIAACHVLHRLCMPRHPPNALTSRLRAHTTNDRTDVRPRSRGSFTQHSNQLRSHNRPYPLPEGSACEPMRSPHRFLEPIHNVKQQMPKAPYRLAPDLLVFIPGKYAAFERSCRRGRLRNPARLERSRCRAARLCPRLVEPIGIEPMT
jgi:hypothetical protein